MLDPTRLLAKPLDANIFKLYRQFKLCTVPNMIAMLEWYLDKTLVSDNLQLMNLLRPCSAQFIRQPCKMIDIATGDTDIYPDMLDSLVECFKFVGSLVDKDFKSSTFKLYYIWDHHVSGMQKVKENHVYFGSHIRGYGGVKELISTLYNTTNESILGVKDQSTDINMNELIYLCTADRR